MHLVLLVGQTVVRLVQCGVGWLVGVVDHVVEDGLEPAVVRAPLLQPALHSAPCSEEYFTLYSTSVCVRWERTVSMLVCCWPGGERDTAVLQSRQTRPRHQGALSSGLNRETNKIHRHFVVLALSLNLQTFGLLALLVRFAPV